jgi:hypothetical protein
VLQLFAARPFYAFFRQHVAQRKAQHFVHVKQSQKQIIGLPQFSPNSDLPHSLPIKIVGASIARPA